MATVHCFRRLEVEVVMVPNDLLNDEQTLIMAFHRVGHQFHHHHHLNALVTTIVMDDRPINQVVDRRVAWPVMSDAFRRRCHVVNDRNHFLMLVTIVN